MIMRAIARLALSLVAVLAAQAAALDPPLTVAPPLPPLTAAPPVSPVIAAPPVQPVIAAPPVPPVTAPAESLGITTTPLANETAEDPDKDGSSATTNLANTLFVTFFCVFLGYAIVQMNLIQPMRGDLIGLGFYVGTIGLPVLVFHVVATSEFGDLDLFVILSCFLGRLAVMALTWVASFLVFKSDRGKGQRILSAGILSFFVVASNDFAVGFPVINALYAGKGMFKYIAANALVSNAVLTPIAMVGLAIGSNIKKQEDDAIANTESTMVPPGGVLPMIKKVVWDILMNPIMMCAIIGFFFKLLLGNIAMVTDEAGKKKFFSPMDQAIAALMKPFGTLALFLTGASLQRPKIQFWPVWMVLMKVVVCAFCTYAFAVYLVTNNPDDPSAEKRLQNFSFLYGMLPANSAPLIFARQFDPEAAGLVATAILFGLVVAGPLMFGAAIFLQGVAHVGALLITIELNTAGCSVICAIFVIIMLLILREDWGYEDPFKLLIAAYLLVVFCHEVTTLLMNAQLAGPLCAEFQKHPIRTMTYSVVRSSARQASRNITLLITFMITTNRFVPDVKDRTVMHGLKLFVGVLVVSVVLGALTAPTAEDICDGHSVIDQVAGSTGEGILNMVVDSLYLIVFGGVTLIWAIKGSHDHANVETSEVSSDSEAEDENEEDWEFEEDLTSGIKVKPWLSKAPKSVMQGLAVLQVVDVMSSFVNVVLHHFESGLEGSYAMMMVIETLLKHANAVILFALLTANLSFARHFMRKLILTFPSLFWSGEEEEDEDSFGGLAAVGTLASHAQFGAIPGHSNAQDMRRLSSAAPTAMGRVGNLYSVAANPAEIRGMPSTAGRAAGRAASVAGGAGVTQRGSFQPAAAHSV